VIYPALLAKNKRKVFKMQYFSKIQKRVQKVFINIKKFFSEKTGKYNE